MAGRVSEQIQKEIAENKIVIFMKGTPEMPQCGFSQAAVETLKKYPYPFKAVDVLAHPEIRETLPQISNWPTFPQVFVNGKLVGGCDILLELDAAGELEKILKETFAS